jgi:hypothetical protein
MHTLDSTKQFSTQNRRHDYAANNQEPFDKLILSNRILL